MEEEGVPASMRTSWRERKEKEEVRTRRGKGKREGKDEPLHR